jgi:hypothetical protein
MAQKQSAERRMSRRRIQKKKAKPKYPAATLMFYGPNDQIATKAVVSIIKNKFSDPENFRKWHTAGTEIRADEEIGREIAAYFKEHGVKQTISLDRIFGCPHEEGIDYPEGESCPQCPFWAGRNRATGTVEH